MRVVWHDGSGGYFLFGENFKSIVEHPHDEDFYIMRSCESYWHLTKQSKFIFDIQ